MKISSLEAQVMALYVQVGIFLHFRDVLDNTQATDQQTRFVGKALAELAQTLDILRRDFGLAKADSALAVEDPVFDVFKVLPGAYATDYFAEDYADDDIVVLRDLAALSFSRPVFDTWFASDVHIADIGKSLLSAAQSADAHLFAFVKDLQDDAAAQSALAFEVHKALANVAETLDAFAIALARPLQDQANVAEALALFLDKTAADAASTQDTSVRDFAKVLPGNYAIDYFAEDYANDDIVVLRDQTRFDLSAFRASQAAASDLFVRQSNFLRSFASDSAVLDTRVQEVVKTLPQTAEVQDSSIRDAAKVLPGSYAIDYFAEDYSNDDIVVLRDATTLQIAPALFTTGFASDVRTAGIGKSLVTGMQSADAVAKYLGCDKSDAATVQEALFQAFSKNVVLDTAQCTDVGTAIAQSYCVDAFYFSSDYVGESRTF